MRALKIFPSSYEFSKGVLRRTPNLSYLEKDGKIRFLLAGKEGFLEVLPDGEYYSAHDLYDLIRDRPIMEFVPLEPGLVEIRLRPREKRGSILSSSSSSETKASPSEASSPRVGESSSPRGAEPQSNRRESINKPLTNPLPSASSNNGFKRKVIIEVIDGVWREREVSLDPSPSPKPERFSYPSEPQTPFVPSLPPSPAPLEESSYVYTPSSAPEPPSPLSSSLPNSQSKHRHSSWSQSKEYPKPQVKERSRHQSEELRKPNPMGLLKNLFSRRQQELSPKPKTTDLPLYGLLPHEEGMVVKKTGKLANSLDKRAVTEETPSSKGEPKEKGSPSINTLEEEEFLIKKAYTLLLGLMGEDEFPAFKLNDYLKKFGFDPLNIKRGLRARGLLQERGAFVRIVEREEYFSPSPI